MMLLMTTYLHRRKEVSISSSSSLGTWERLGAASWRRLGWPAPGTDERGSSRANVVNQLFCKGVEI